MLLKKKKILEDLKTLLFNTKDKTEQEKIKTKIENQKMIIQKSQEKLKNLYLNQGIDGFISAGGDGSLNVEKQLIKEQILSDVRELVKELPEEQKEVLVMRMYKDMSFKEISENTGVSINTALGRMRYALINLRKLIEKHNIILVNE